MLIISMKIILILNSIISLLLGTFIYIFFRASSLKIFSWIKIFGIDLSNSDFRKYCLLKINNIPKWVIYSLPDGLWTFSYVAMMLGIWDSKVNKRSIIWIALIPLIAVISELGQKIKIISGTYDQTDLLFYFIGFVTPILYLSINQLNFKNYNL